MDKFTLLSRTFSGDIMVVVHKKEYKKFNIGNFFVRGLYLPTRIRRLKMIRNFLYAVFTIIASVYFHFFKSKYDAIITYDPLTTGIIALIIGKLTGAKVIVEVNGNYGSPVNWGLNKNNNSYLNTKELVSFLKFKITYFIIPFTVNHAHAVKVLYGDQLKSFHNKIRISHKMYRFHDFVPISRFKECQEDKKYILFLGHPWHRKGIDILIKAFNKISVHFPEYTLKIVGHFPGSEKTFLEELAQSNGSVEICGPVWYEDVTKLMPECTMFALPSRSEAMGMVLLEAMASKKPIIASNVDGIPTYIKDGYNGLLFEPGNINELSEKMSLILQDKNYASRLAENAKEYVLSNLSEEVYVNRYNDMLMKA
jgi:glycosyltransferase involved in cell wall biosynthesis